MALLARVLTLILGLALLSPSPSAETGETATWPQWRGPARDGVVAGADWPSDLAGLERVWRVELGKGYPGPIVAGDRVFVVETVEDEAAQVRALDRATGATLWTRNWPSKGDVPFFAASNGDWVRSTPAWDGATLYVGDMREVLVALDGKTGDVRWRVDLPERFEQPIPDFGFASSPLVDDGAVYVQAANSLVKLDAKTGETVWRALDGKGKITESGAFSSPVLATLGGKRQLVVLTRLALHGVDPEDGSVLWRQEVPNFRGMNILTPTVVGDAIFTSPYRERSYRYDVGRPAADGPFTVATAWDNPATGYMSSAVVVDGHAYMHLGNRRLDCIDLATGESRWRTSESFGKYWSMVTDGSKILALDETGELILFAADPAGFRALDRREVGDPETWGHLAVAGDELFVRELEAVSMWRWLSPADAPAGDAASR
jgi:outer membrane protein assembly factor BamB